MGKDKDIYMLIGINELTNLAIDLMNKYKLSERDMCLVFRGASLKMYEMEQIRTAYNEVLRPDESSLGGEVVNERETDNNNENAF